MNQLCWTFSANFDLNDNEQIPPESKIVVEEIANQNFKIKNYVPQDQWIEYDMQNEEIIDTIAENSQLDNEGSGQVSMDEEKSFDGNEEIKTEKRLTEYQGEVTSTNQNNETLIDGFNEPTSYNIMLVSGQKEFKTIASPNQSQPTL